MAENVWPPVGGGGRGGQAALRNRYSPRKHPYERMVGLLPQVHPQPPLQPQPQKELATTTTTTGNNSKATATATSGRSPLKTIQASLQQQPLVTQLKLVQNQLKVRKVSLSTLTLNSSSKPQPQQISTSTLTSSSQPQLHTTLALFSTPGQGQQGVPRRFLTERHEPLFEAPEYILDILSYWTVMEGKYRIKWDYMERHEGISHKMRSILIDWLVEVVSEYELNEETLHLTVNYIDRFLSRMNVIRTKLQLVGAAALFVAAKFEEMNPPEVADYVFVTDEAYTKKEILAMETCMLSCLEFDLMMPTAYSMAQCYCSLLDVHDPARSLVMYLVDLSLMQGEVFLRFLPSVIAGAAIALARFSFGGIFWDADLEKYCGHRQMTIIPAVRHLHKAFFDAPTKAQTAIFEKYQAVRYCSISNAFIPNNGPWDETTSN